MTFVIVVNALPSDVDREIEVESTLKYEPESHR